MTVQASDFVFSVFPFSGFNSPLSYLNPTTDLSPLGVSLYLTAVLHVLFLSFSSVDLRLSELLRKIHGMSSSRGNDTENTAHFEEACDDFIYSAMPR